MPGLLRAMGRTAVVAGTATAVSNRVSRRQANRWAAQEAQEAPPQQYYAPPPPPAAEPGARPRRAAHAAGRVEGQGDPHRGGVRAAEGQAPRMSTLIAIAYPDVATAEKVREELVQATKEHLVELEDAVVIENRPGGKIKLHQAMSPAGAGAAGGALWGGLIGLIFLAPLLGMAVGAASGAVAGKVTDVGVDDNFMKDLGAKLPGRRRRCSSSAAATLPTR